MKDLQTIKNTLRSMGIDGLVTESLKQEQASCPVVHSFGPGLYIREVTLPEGAFCIGHHHKTETFNIMLKGKILMLKEDGSKQEISAPMMFTSPPGQKMGLVLEEVSWLNIYPTSETDIETLETTYLDKTDIPERGTDATIDNNDYVLLLSELSMTEAQVREQVENKADQIPMPYGSYKFGVFCSGIHGKGVFATSDVIPGEIIAPTRVGGKRTPVGRFTNHSLNPNAKMIEVDGNIYLEAITSIKGCQGGQKGEEITTNYRETIELVHGGITCQQ